MFCPRAGLRIFARVSMTTSRAFGCSVSHSSRRSAPPTSSLGHSVCRCILSGAAAPFSTFFRRFLSRFRLPSNARYNVSPCSAHLRPKARPPMATSKHAPSDIHDLPFFGLPTRSERPSGSTSGMTHRVGSNSIPMSSAAVMVGERYACASRGVGPSGVSSHQPLKLVPRSLYFSVVLLFVLNRVNQRQDQVPEKTAPDDVHLGFLYGGAGVVLPLLLAKPCRRALGQLYIVLDGQRNHRFPELAVITTVELEVNQVTAATTPVAPPPPGRIDVK